MKKKKDGEGGSQNGQAKIPIYSITYERWYTTIYARHTVNTTGSFFAIRKQQQGFSFHFKNLIFWLSLNVT